MLILIRHVCAYLTPRIRMHVFAMTLPTLMFTHWICNSATFMSTNKQKQWVQMLLQRMCVCVVLFVFVFDCLLTIPFRIVDCHGIVFYLKISLMHFALCARDLRIYNCSKAKTIAYLIADEMVAFLRRKKQLCCICKNYAKNVIN